MVWAYSLSFRVVWFVVEWKALVVGLGLPHGRLDMNGRPQEQDFVGEATVGVAWYSDQPWEQEWNTSIRSEGAETKIT